MKKIIFVILVFVFGLSGCGYVSSAPDIQVQTDEDTGTKIVSTGGITITHAEALPEVLVYNGNEITVSGVSVYQYYNEDEYYYSIAAVITFDASSLDDASYHWLVEEDLDMSASLTSEQNDYDDYSMGRLGCMTETDEKKITYVFQSNSLHDSSSSRYSFTGSVISLLITSTQEEKYEYTNSAGETSSLHCENWLSYDYEIPENLPSYEDIQEPLYSTMNKWLQNRIELYSSLY